VDAVADDGSARSEIVIARAWLGAVLDVRDEAENQSLEKLQDARRLPENTSEEEDLHDEAVDAAREQLKRVREHAFVIAKLDKDLAKAQDAASDKVMTSELRRAVRRVCHTSLLSRTETHAVWSHIIRAMDDLVLDLNDRIDADAARLTGSADAGTTKPGKQAVKLLQLIDLASNDGLLHRGEIVALDAHQMVVYVDEPVPSAEKRHAKDTRKACLRYASYVKFMERAQRKFRKLVDAAIKKAGPPDDPGDECTPTFEDSPWNGGGWIELQVGNSAVRRYPVITTFSLRSGIGTTHISGYSDGGPYQGDFLFIALDDAVDRLGTYAFEKDGELRDPGKPRFVFDTRGDLGDPFQDNNFSASDWERDVISGTLTITTVDVSKDNRVLEGTFTLETAFLDNPEGQRGEATITGSFHCCDFRVTLENGSPDDPE
jgi:hypothetical protein